MKLLTYLAGWKGYLATLLVGLGMAWYVQSLRLDSVELERDTARERVVQLTSDNRICAENVREVKEAWADYQEQTNKIAEATAQRLKEQREVNKKNLGYIENLKSLRPSDPDNLCRSADDLFIKWMNERRVK